jgi:hypothetical protein
MLGVRTRRKVQFLAFFATRLVPCSPEPDHYSSRFGPGLGASGVVVMMKLYYVVPGTSFHLR